MYHTPWSGFMQAHAKAIHALAVTMWLVFIANARHQAIGLSVVKDIALTSKAIMLQPCASAGAAACVSGRLLHGSCSLHISAFLKQLQVNLHGTGVTTRCGSRCAPTGLVSPHLCDKHVCEGRCSGAQAWVLVLCQGTHAVAKACMRELSPDPY